MWNGNMPEIITTILVWIVIIYFANRIYKRQEEQPKVWKIALVLITGIFSFSINFPIFNTFISLAILPLGVWILFGILHKKEKRWNSYRSYAWLGFLANYLFLLAFLLSILIHQIIFPKNTIHTFIGKTNEAEIINIHPTANEHMVLSKNFHEMLNEFKEGEFYNQTWYDETYMIVDMTKRNERFPYLLANTSPKWGSGLDVTVFIENDGRGLLVATPKEKFYFQSDRSILEEEK